VFVDWTIIIQNTAIGRSPPQSPQVPQIILSPKNTYGYTNQKNELKKPAIPGRCGELIEILND
jgi:hypothetical protein